ncbi:DUF1671-domain-containing protein [Saccharata proteae CBS 121410]|uniref:DUF1671-domain-containing protein n=1 Tax=Saccharata proteae CBS 121410 TaxID=1314787 RepID=A0A9P4HU35_9PEZI|nr:DUF1671-domain-containing protein [Saccharata proteae CBS 121410]
MADMLECPFCEYTETDSYVLILHVEQFHTQNSPFVVRETSHGLPESLLNPQKEEVPSATSAQQDASADDAQWVLCPQPDCGEQIHLAELDEHADFHMAEQLTAGDKPPSPSGMHYPITPQHSLDHLSNFSTSLPDDLRQSKTRKRSDSEKTSLSRSILDILSPPSSTKSNNSKLKNKFGNTRLGKSELGPYAYEDHMPRWLHKQLEAGPKTTQQTTIGRDGKLVKHEVVENETPAILPILAQLLAADKSVKQAYLCHPSTVHICKTPKAGGFCGYRNIQMLVSYMQGARAQGYDKFPGRTPGILKLQDLIEVAWDKGINQIGRAQTGGIKDTRKYIGTPEVMALFQSLGIDYGVQAFTDRRNEHAYEQLLTDVEHYFKIGTKDGDAKVHKTNLPPIYLQQPGHSISIVGFERYKDGSRDILVFDPMFSTSPGMCRLLGRKDIRTSRPEVLQAYRRDSRQLKKHRDFEIVK